MPTRMTIFSSLVRPTDSHIVNGLIHGVVVNAIVIALMLCSHWLERTAQIHYTLLPLALFVGVLSIGSTFAAGFIPNRLYTTRMVSDAVEGSPYDGGTVYWRYLIALLGTQYVGWGMVFLELTARMNERSAQVSGASYGGSAWGVFIIGLMPMVIPIAGALLSVPMKARKPQLYALD